MLRLALALTALLALPACGELCGQQPVAVLPVRVVQDIPLVPAVLNGRPATLLLDTGAQTFVLTEAAVARLGLATDARMQVAIGGIGGRSRSCAAVLRDIHLAPGFRLPDTYAGVLTTALPTPGGIRIDGLFGVGVLNRWDVELDMPAARVVLHAGPACPGPPASYAGAATLPNVATAGGRFAIPVTLDGAALAALIDTGAQSTIVNSDAAKQAGATDAALAADPPQMLMGVGADQVQARRHRFGVLRVGHDIAPNPTLAVMPPIAGINEAILGFDYLARRRVWLSAARNLVFIARPTPP